MHCKHSAWLCKCVASQVIQNDVLVTNIPKIKESLAPNFSALIAQSPLEVSLYSSSQHLPPSSVLCQKYCIGQTGLRDLSSIALFPPILIRFGPISMPQFLSQACELCFVRLLSWDQFPYIMSVYGTTILKNTESEAPDPVLDCSFRIVRVYILAVL